MRHIEETNMLKRGGCLAYEMYGYRNLFRATNLMQPAMNYCSASDDNPLKLPHLPVPRLEDTLKKYKETVRPHLTDEEFKTTSALIEQFGVKGGVGDKLQSLLEERAKKHSNWLTEWWVNYAYLENRMPIIIHSNPGLVFPFRKFANQKEQLKCAAQIILASLDFKLLIDKAAIPQERFGKEPLDMSQYSKVFGTTRIPGIKRDTQSFNESTYITVIHKNHIFHLDMFGDDCVMLNEEQMVKQLEEIVSMSKHRASNPVGILTSEDRNVWGKAYESLIKDKKNKANLKDIERSQVVLCLDECIGLWELPDKTARQTVAGGQMLHGGGSRCNGGNRWFDKTIQFVVGADGVNGLTYEHSPAEGQPIAVMTDYIMDFIDKNKSVGRKASSKVIPPTRLDFDIPSDVECMIRSAEDHLDKMVCDLELICFTFENFGSKFIKSQKLSPDSFIQMAIQYAFYKLHNVPGAHYESAATRMFLWGRTETIRSCSNESVAFARTMLDCKATDKEKLAGLLAAIKAHKDYVVQALQGLGVDRHLLGLKLIAIENSMDIPKLYLDIGYVKSAHMRISTSQVACKCDGFMCYGPLVPDGYATCYNPRPDSINIATAAFNCCEETSCQEYKKSLESALQEMHDVLMKNTKSKL